MAYSWRLTKQGYKDKEAAGERGEGGSGRGVIIGQCTAVVLIVVGRGGWMGVVIFGPWASFEKMFVHLT